MTDFKKQLEMVLYHSDDGNVSVDAYISEDCIWVSQKGMSEIFGVGIPAISKHLANIFNDGELDKRVVVSKMETTTRHGAIEGKTQQSEIEKAHSEYEIFNKTQKIDSDFDKFIHQITGD